MIGDVGAALELLGIAVIFVLAVIGSAVVVVHAYLSVNPYHGRHVRDDGIDVLTPKLEIEPGAVWNVPEPVNRLIGFHTGTGAPVYQSDLESGKVASTDLVQHGQIELGRDHITSGSFSFTPDGATFVAQPQFVTDDAFNDALARVRVRDRDLLDRLGGVKDRDHLDGRGSLT